MIHPLPMGEIARIGAAIRALCAIPHPSSDTAVCFLPLHRRGAAGGNPVTPVTGSNPFDERTGDSEADSLVGGAQCVRIHDRGYCL